jgi:hypothetical protein
MTNLGAEAGNWECTARASDPSGAYSGWDILSSTSPLRSTRNRPLQRLPRHHERRRCLRHRSHS